ncbi:MAG: tRNA adenosine deaminase-associated protein [Mycobacteriaceae bacterium]
MSDDDHEGSAIAVVREDGQWHCTPMRAKALTSLSAAVTELRELRSAGAAFGLLDVDGEFFLVVRPGPQGVRLVVSDATAAIDYDIAEDALDVLNVEVPDLDADELDDTEPWAEGELGLLDDLGLPETVLNIIVSETDLYPDEQLAMIAERCGFADELSAAVDAFGR